MNVAVLYEDWETGIRAKLTCDQLEQSMAPVMKLYLDLWRFDLLEEHALLNQAASAASGSNLVLISAHGHQLLPPAIGSWLQQWLLQKQDVPSALVLSLDLCHKGSSIVGQILQSLAPILQTAQVELFSHFGYAPPLSSESTMATPLLQHPPASPTSPQQSRQSNMGRPGLNHRHDHR